jgi:hypothetical protein
MSELVSIFHDDTRQIVHSIDGVEKRVGRTAEIEGKKV